MDGLRMPLIISDLDDPYIGQYDEDLIVTLSGMVAAILSNDAVKLIPFISMFRLVP